MALVTVFFSATITGQELTHAQKQSTGNLNFLSKMDGKYPFDVKLIEKPALKSRLQKLLGATEYDYMKKNLRDVATPIKVKKGYFYSWAMQAHSGNEYGATIMADIEKNVLYVVIRRDSQDKMYSENGGPLPTALQDMAKDK